MCSFGFAVICILAVYGCWQLCRDLFLRIFCPELQHAAWVLPIYDSSDIPLLLQQLYRCRCGCVLLDCRSRKTALHIPAAVNACYAADIAQAAQRIACYLPTAADSGEEEPP
ncbi:MAG: hypothetical protein IKV55_00200 [Oscillospiraceae bacterium]|nr:hypothetical protein [Oscillospiraceae bacterium]